MTKTLVLQHLERLTTEDGIRYRHPLVRWILMTEGVTHVAKSSGAFWLLDVIAFAQADVPAVAEEPFQS
jgi:hypothetical protein